MVGHDANSEQQPRLGAIGCDHCVVRPLLHLHWLPAAQVCPTVVSPHAQYRQKILNYSNARPFQRCLTHPQKMNFLLQPLASRVCCADVCCASRVPAATERDQDTHENSQIQNSTRGPGRLEHLVRCMRGGDSHALGSPEGRHPHNPRRAGLRKRAVNMFGKWVPQESLFLRQQGKPVTAQTYWTTPHCIYPPLNMKQLSRGCSQRRFSVVQVWVRFG